MRIGMAKVCWVRSATGRAGIEAAHVHQHSSTSVALGYSPPPPCSPQTRRAHTRVDVSSVPRAHQLQYSSDPSDVHAPAASLSGGPYTVVCTHLMYAHTGIHMTSQPQLM